MITLERLTAVNTETFLRTNNLAFADYINGHQEMDGAGFAITLTASRIHLQKSYFAKYGEQPAGFGLVAVRGSALRLASMGVVPEFRRHGIGRQILEKIIAEAPDAGYQSLELECFSENHGARSLYESLGFKPVRKLFGFERASSPDSKNSQPLALDPHLAALRLDQYYDLSMPWQITGNFLTGCGTNRLAFATDLAVCAVRLSAKKPHLTLGSLAVAPAARKRGEGRRLIESLYAKYPAHEWFVPNLVPEEAHGFFIKLGFTELPRHQLQMRLVL